MRLYSAEVCTRLLTGIHIPLLRCLEDQDSIFGVKMFLNFKYLPSLTLSLPCVCVSVSLCTCHSWHAVKAIRKCGKEERLSADVHLTRVPATPSTYRGFWQQTTVPAGVVVTAEWGVFHGPSMWDTVRCVCLVHCLCAARVYFIFCIYNSKQILCKQCNKMLGEDLSSSWLRRHGIRSVEHV